MSDRLYIVGNIDSNLYREFSEAVLKLEEAKVENASIEFMSAGGDEDVGLGLYGRIMSSSVKFFGIAHGGVHSAALLPLLACKTRIATPECTFLLHFTEDKVKGDYRNLKKESDRLQKAEQRWCKIVAACVKTGTTEETFLKLSSESSILTSEEAVHYGIIHGIVENIEPQPRQKRRKRSE